MWCWGFCGWVTRVGREGVHGKQGREGGAWLAIRTNGGGRSAVRMGHACGAWRGVAKATGARARPDPWRLRWGATCARASRPLALEMGCAPTMGPGSARNGAWEGTAVGQRGREERIAWAWQPVPWGRAADPCAGSRGAAAAGGECRVGVACAELTGSGAAPKPPSRDVLRAIRRRNRKSNDKSAL